MIYFKCDKEHFQQKKMILINNFSDLVDIKNDNDCFLIHYPENIDFINMHIRNIEYVIKLYG